MRRAILPLLVLASQTVSAAPLRVAVVDTGIDYQNKEITPLMCPDGHQDFTGTGLQDTHGHGSNVIGLIKNFAHDKEYCIIVIKYYLENVPDRINMRREISSLRHAVSVNADIVNLSGGGPSFDEDEFEIIRGAKNTKFMVAAGNEGQDISLHNNEYFPASYGLPNILVVGNLEPTGVKAPKSNYGDQVEYWEVGVRAEGAGIVMTGTSQATAIATGKFIAGTLKKRKPKSF